MDYNFPSNKRGPRPTPLGYLVLFLIAGTVSLKFMPTTWRTYLPPAVEQWRAKTFPDPSPTPKFRPTATAQPKKPWARPSYAPHPTASVEASQPDFTPTPTSPKVARATPNAPSEVTLSNLPLRLPGPPIVNIIRDARIRELETKVAKYPVFALYRALIQHHLELGNTEEAAHTYHVQANLYRQKGLNDAATIQENLAAQLETTVRLFAIGTGSATSFTHAPLEPQQGCYLGAFIDRDDSLTTRFTGDNWQYHHLPSEFEAQTKRRHATIFTYVKWGNFPREWLRLCKRESVIPHIAWEPQNLNEVQDNAYLRDCAQFLRDLDWPVFVRFAGEMNGHWTPYHSNPALYRQKFRLVHQVLHHYAPKVADIWCVNAIPSDNIAVYYPGDDGCDWVGVNLYSTPFADNDRTRAAFQQSPLTLLNPVYQQFSKRKPIAICEYGASHQSAVDKEIRIPFAVEKMSLLYGALPLLYPRVKMINYFSTNNFIHARPGRQLNNYRLTQIPAIETAYRELTASPHFITSYQQATQPPLAPAPTELSPSPKLRRGQRLWMWITSNNALPLVYVQAGTKVIYAARHYGKHVIDLENIPNNAQNLTILVYNSQARCLTKKEILLTP